MESLYEIGKNFFLIRTKEKDFHRNIYIKIYENNGHRVNFIFDPGAVIDVRLLNSHLKSLIGGIENIDVIFITHQDPDVCSNVPLILANSPKSIILASIDSLRFIKMFGIPDRKMYGVENLGREIVKIKKTGHRVQIFPTRYCHARGAIMFYDFETKILFSGDFLAGLNTKKEEGIWATEKSWHGISLFHQIYMPNNEVIKETINKIGMLDPLPEIIAPQHGDLIKGELIPEFLSRLLNLDVGIDLIKKESPDRENLIDAINAFLEEVKEKTPSYHRVILNMLKKHGDFTTPFIFSGDTLTDINVLPEDAITYIHQILNRILPEDMVDSVRGRFFRILKNRGIDLPEHLHKKEVESGIFEEVIRDIGELLS